jgi:hypothetical protein
MSSSKSSTSSSSSNTNVAFDGVDGIAIAGDGNSVQVLDGGVIENAFDFGESALNLLDSQNARVLNFGAETTQKALSYTQDIIASNTEKQGEQMNNLFLYLGLAGLVVLGLKYVR